MFEHVQGLKLKKVPQLWNTFCRLPGPKIKIKDLNSYRLVALILHLMKALEILVLVHLCPMVSSLRKLLAFAY